MGRAAACSDYSLHGAAACCCQSVLVVDTAISLHMTRTAALFFALGAVLQLKSLTPYLLLQ